MITLLGNNAGYEGDSNDVKPTDVPVNTIFRELDTNCKYYYTGEAWVEIPGGGGGGGGGTDSYNDLENKPQINSVTLSGNKSLSALGIQGELTFDNAPTEDSTNPVESGGVYEALALKQDTLTIDSAPTENSTNPVESGGVYTALGNKQDTLTFNGAYNASTNPAATVSTVTGAISTAVSNLTKSDVGLANVTNNEQIKAVSGSVTSGGIVTFGGDGATVADSTKTIETTLTDTNNKIPTSKSIIDNAAGAEKLTGYSADSAEATIAASTTVTGAIEQLDYRTQTNKTNILSIEKANGTKNYVYNFGEISNGGCKYVYNTNGSVSVTGTKSGSLSIAELISNANLSDYDLSAGDSIVLVSDNANVAVVVIFSDGTTQDSAISAYNETKTVTIPSGRTKWYVRLQVKPATTGTINETVKPMICTKALYDIDNSFVPYALSNANITPALVDAVDSGAKNKLKLPSSALTTNGVTFTPDVVNGTITITRVSASGSDAYYDIETSLGDKYVGNVLSGGASSCSIMISKANGTGAINIRETAGIIPDTATNKLFLYVRSTDSPDNLVLKPMICSQADWNVSKAFMPYAMNNVDLTIGLAQCSPQITANISTAMDSFSGNRVDLGYVGSASTIPNIASQYVVVRTYSCDATLDRRIQIVEGANGGRASRYYNGTSWSWNS